MSNGNNEFDKKRREKVQNFNLDMENGNDEDSKNLSYFKSIESHSKHFKDSKKQSLHKGKKSENNSKIFKFVWVITVVSIALLLSLYTISGVTDLLAIGREERVAQVTIPKESGAATIASALSERGVIRNPSFFRIYLIVTKSTPKIRQGAFEIKTNMDYAAIVNYLKSDANRLDSDIAKVMITEGKNVQEIAEIMEKNEICSKNDFLKVCNSNDLDEQYEFLKEAGGANVVYKAEGYLFPDTYNFYKNTEAKAIISKLLSNYSNKVNKKEATSDSDEKVSVAERAKNAGISMRELINLASLIQAEAANEDDMYMVSSVIQNRLRTISRGGVSPFGEDGLSLLGIDSTVWYPYRRKEAVPENIISKYPTEYDTYKYKGLPPGPICNPGIIAIDAALSPKNTQYYYFCHSKDEKKPYYAKTLPEHNANLKKAGLV